MNAKEFPLQTSTHFYFASSICMMTTPKTSSLSFLRLKLKKKRAKKASPVFGKPRGKTSKPKMMSQVPLTFK